MKGIIIIPLLWLKNKQLFYVHKKTAVYQDLHQSKMFSLFSRIYRILCHFISINPFRLAVPSR